MKTYDIGSRLYVQKLYWTSDNPPLYHTDHTQEIEPPYRTGRCLVLRLPFTKMALVVGKWVGSLREEDALLNATGGRVTKDNGISINELEDWAL